MLKHRMTAIASLLVACALFYASTGHDMGYQFPEVMGIAMIALTGALTALSFKRATAGIAADEENIPWERIWPALAIFAGYLLLATPLGFFAASFAAFFILTLIYAPGRMSWARVAWCGGVGAVFMGVLYLIFVLLLNVQMPHGLIF